MLEMLKKFTVNDGFFGRFRQLVTDVVIPYQEKALRDEIEGAVPSYAIKNFELAAEWQETGHCSGEHHGYVFQDSDLAKWIEAVAYSLIASPDPALEQRVDEVIDLIGRAQFPDGYLNTYFTIKAPKERWTNLQEAHELYCAGHMMEAAVAYAAATGKQKLMEIMMRMKDNIYQHFITEKAPGYPGHPEIELALLKMYEATGDAQCLELAEHFINVRGVDPDYYVKEAANRPGKVWGMDPKDRAYAQNDVPVRAFLVAEGHAVRAVYLYTAMAELARRTEDCALKDACQRVWRNITQKQMYVTGGIGSSAQGEAFSVDYNLPNDIAYSETCAAIGLVFFARRMAELFHTGEYGDIMEQALYNTVLAGMQLDGRRFFYVNPLEVVPGVAGVVPANRDVLPVRPKWYGCACCPPNVARTLTSLACYAWEEGEDVVWSHLFVGGTLDLRDTKGVTIDVQTNYPLKGKVVYTMHPVEETASFTLAVRIPAWCEGVTLRRSGQKIYSRGMGTPVGDPIGDGFAFIEGPFREGDTVELSMDLKPRRIFANTHVAADSGCVAFAYGPLIYCAEGVDNHNEILSVRASRSLDPVMVPITEGPLQGLLRMDIPGYRLESDDGLYSARRPRAVPYTVRAIPYFAWANRGENEMRVWLPEL